MPLFTADAAAAIDGPDWLRARRVAAAERFASTSLPSAEEEVWRYSRVDELDLDEFRPGRGDTSWSAAADETAGLTVGWLGDGTVPGADQVLGSVATRPTDVFAELNDAFSTDPVVLRVARGAALDRPIELHHHVDEEGEAVFPRLVIEAGESSEVTVVDRYTSGDVRAFVAPVVEVAVGRAARVTYLCVQELGPKVWQIASQISAVHQEASFVAASIALGGDYARLRTDCRMEGRGSTGTLLSAYFGEGDQTLDFRTFQDHRAPDTTSNLLFKGAVGGRSRSVYTGLIRVRKEARGTNAFQTNRNIKLSEHAWAESVPNLEIENNDVHCSHASTVGPVDEEQRFYLESRGVPPAVADRLVVGGFFDEVLRQLPGPDLVASLEPRIDAKLDRMTAAA